MNIEALREQLKIDEGVKYEIYKDHLGFKTIGYGHKIVHEDKFVEGKSYSKEELEKINSSFKLIYSMLSGLYEITGGEFTKADIMMLFLEPFPILSMLISLFPI